MCRLNACLDNFFNDLRSRKPGHSARRYGFFLHGHVTVSASMQFSPYSAPFTWTSGLIRERMRRGSTSSNQVTKSTISKAAIISQAVAERDDRAVSGLLYCWIERSELRATISRSACFDASWIIKRWPAWSKSKEPLRVAMVSFRPRKAALFSSSIRVDDFLLATWACCSSFFGKAILKTSS